MQGTKDDVAGPHARGDSPRPKNPLGAEVAHHLLCGARAPKGFEEKAHGVLNLLIGIEHQYLAARIVDVANRRTHPELAATSLVELAAEQTRAQQVELGLTHRPLQPEQQPIVEVPRVVDAVLVQDERFGERTDLEQAVPVGGIARQARDLQTHHDADSTEADIGDQALKAVALGGRRARQPKVLVDDDELLGAPAERLSSPLQIVLPRCALAIVVHLMERRLTNIQVCEPTQMVDGYLALYIHSTASSSPRLHARTIPARTMVNSARTEGGGVGRGSRGESCVSISRCRGAGGARAVSAPIQELMPRARNSTSP